MKKDHRLLLFMASIFLLVSVPAGSVPNDDPLLEQGHTLSQNLGGRERIPYLIELCNISASINPPAEKTTEYSMELFSLASTEPEGDLHVLGQKNAATCLSSVDPQAAIDHLFKIDFQRPDPKKPVIEDPRYNAAKTIFLKLLASSKTTKTVDSITATARYLGQTGQYPYLGVAEVIDQLPPSSSFKVRINTLLTDALTFYATETGFYNRDQEFLRLLQSLKNPAINRSLAARAVTTFADRLAHDPLNPPGDYYAEIVSNGRVIPFHNRTEAFRFRAFPQIQHFNAPVATKLRQQDPRLNDARDDMQYISGGFFQGDPASGQATQEHRRLLQRSLLRRINEQPDSNPQAALDLAQRLTDPSARIVGFAAVIPAFARTYPSQTQAIYQKQLSALDDLPDSIDRVKAIIALAKAADHITNSDDYKRLSGEAFDDALRFFDHNEADRIQNREGFPELQDLVTFTASHATNVLQAKIQGLPNDPLHNWLKAYLWLYQAKAQQKSGSQNH